MRIQNFFANNFSRFAQRKLGIMHCAICSSQDFLGATFINRRLWCSPSFD